MPKHDNTNRGVLFREDKKSDKHPDYKGRINTNGTDFWLSAWVQESADGRKYMSLSVQKMDAKPASKTPAKNQPDDDRDLPF